VWGWEAGQGATGRRRPPLAATGRRASLAGWLAGWLTAAVVPGFVLEGVVEDEGLLRDDGARLGAHAQPRALDTAEGQVQP
jgi:hypothetical protein